VRFTFASNLRDYIFELTESGANEIAMLMLYPYERECGKRNLSASTGGTARNSSLRFPDGTGTLSVDWTDRSVQHTPGEIIFSQFAVGVVQLVRTFACHVESRKLTIFEKRYLE
jgi:hypothetical protein